MSLKRRVIRRYLRYDKITGLIETECILTLQAKGHMRIELEGVSYRLMDVVYVLVNGDIPEHTKVVQINKNKIDFRLDNLHLDTSKRDKIAIKKAQEEARQKAITLDERFDARRIQFSIG